jgi:hypothetical protein
LLQHMLAYGIVYVEAFHFVSYWIEMKKIEVKSLRFRYPHYAWPKKCNITAMRRN